jgi:hypothetical protein
MPIVHECAAPDCRVLTMGRFCLEHEDVEEMQSHLESLLDALATTEPLTLEP